MYPRLTRIAAGGLTLAAVLAIPAAAQAKPHTAAVLRVDRAHHRLELVNSRHVARSYTVAGKLARRVARGSLVVYSAKGKRITKLRLKGRAPKLAYLGKVVSSGRSGVVLRLADGRRVRLGKKPKAAHRVSAAGNVSIQLEGLQRGQVVLITETFDGHGNVVITIKLVQAPDASGGEDQNAVGTITAIAADGSSLTVKVEGQGEMTFQTDSDLVDGLSVGDVVDVTYYQDSDGTLVADDVQYADDGFGDDKDAVGTVTAISHDGSTLTLSVDGGSDMTFKTDADLLDGVGVGDHVDVTYFKETDGSLVADNVELVDDGSGSGHGSGH